MKIPQHIAIIMDGNGRWARRRALPRTAGHKIGIDKIDETARNAKKLGVRILTMFAFSTENWNRPQDEVDFLFTYLDKFIDKYKEGFIKEKVRLRMIGRRDRIKKGIIDKIEDLEQVTSVNENLILNVALDFGGRWDIMQAAKSIFSDLQDNKICDEDINEEFFGKRLSLGDLPQPDLLIRTSGEHRISNFLLWDFAYSELYFPKVLWPDFNMGHLKKAIKIFSKRERRFGKIQKHN